MVNFFYNINMFNVRGVKGFQGVSEGVKENSSEIKYVASYDSFISSLKNKPAITINISNYNISLGGLF